MSPVPDDICNIKMMMPIIATHFLNKTKFTPYTENIYKIIQTSVLTKFVCGVDVIPIKISIDLWKWTS